MSFTRLQLEGPDLNALLAQVREEYGDGARIVQAEKVRSGGVGGFFARERFHLQVDVPESARRPRPPEPSPMHHLAAPTSVLELAERINDEEEARLRRSPAVAGAGPVVSTESDSFAAVLGRLQRTASAEPTAPSRPEWASSRAGAAAATTTLAAPSVSPLLAPGGLGGAEGALGIPARVLHEDPAASSLYSRLLAWLETCPKAPPPAFAPGQVIAVVGEVTPALRVAGILAGEIGADPRGVFVAAPARSSLPDVPGTQMLAGAADVARHRQRWGRGAESRVVVIEAPLLLRPEGWARSVLAALAPTFTWGVAQAATKLADVSVWADRLGTVDALAIEHLAATGDPASVLASPIPVGLIDGRRATATAWASVLAERLGRQS